MGVPAIKGLAGSADARSETSQQPRLSTDFLNRYSEALMLIEMAADDDGIVDDLKAWHSITYREHFEVSGLRCAPSALAAYDSVAPARRAGFDVPLLSDYARSSGLTGLVVGFGGVTDGELDAALAALDRGLRG